MLPSFRRKIEGLVDAGDIHTAKNLMQTDQDLILAVESAIRSKNDFVHRHLRKMYALSKTILLAKCQPISIMDLYVKTMANKSGEQTLIEEVLDSIKHLTPTEVVRLIEAIEIELGAEGVWNDSDGETMERQGIFESLVEIRSRIAGLCEEAEKTGAPLRSRYATQSKAVRTTVIAQKVHLSKEEAILTEQDTSFTNLVDELLSSLTDLFSFEVPHDYFLHEVWLYDSKSPNREVFMARPRHAIERALSSPHDYLGCTCCNSSEGLSSSQPATSILYQLYLESGGLVNVFDLWSAFFTIVGGEDGEDCDERTALMLFYKALADLKLLGMVKQSRKKTDHLAKLLWKNL